MAASRGAIAIIRRTMTIVRRAMAALRSAMAGYRRIPGDRRRKMPGSARTGRDASVNERAWISDARCTLPYGRVSTRGVYDFGAVGFILIADTDRR